MHAELGGDLRQVQRPGHGEPMAAAVAEHRLALRAMCTYTPRCSRIDGPGSSARVRSRPSRRTCSKMSSRWRNRLTTSSSPYDAVAGPDARRGGPWRGRRHRPPPRRRRCASAARPSAPSRPPRGGRGPTGHRAPDRSSDGRGRGRPWRGCSAAGRSRCAAPIGVPSGLAGPPAGDRARRRVACLDQRGGGHRPGYGIGSAVRWLVSRPCTADGGAVPRPRSRRAPRHG